MADAEHLAKLSQGIDAWNALRRENADIRAHLSRADLTGAGLYTATLVNTDLGSADLTGCHVNGISAWGLRLSENTKQWNLIITRDDASEVRRIVEARELETSLIPIRTKRHTIQHELIIAPR